jgi:hypothetical protein
MGKIAVSLIVFLAAAAPAAAQGTVSEQDSRNLNLAAYAELLRSDVRTEKIAILTELMNFTEAEDKAFWPLYRAYDADMTKLSEERVELITQYGRNYAALTDAMAATLGTKALELEARRHAVKAKHFEIIKKALSPRTALRFLQVEQQLLLIIDLQISAALPIVK